MKSKETCKYVTRCNTWCGVGVKLLGCNSFFRAVQMCALCIDVLNVQKIIININKHIYDEKNNKH